MTDPLARRSVKTRTSLSFANTSGTGSMASMRLVATARAYFAGAVRRWFLDRPIGAPCPA